VCTHKHPHVHHPCLRQGDRLDTDIVLGAEGGLRTIMPMTGVTTQEELNEAIKVCVYVCVSVCACVRACICVWGDKVQT